MHRRNRRPLARLAAVAALFLAAAPAAYAGSKIFELTDPRGDDHGDGDLVYPLVVDYQKGDLDLLSFTARKERGGTRFELAFANRLRVPERGAINELGTDLTDIARLGFYNLNVDIYIDMDRKPGSGALAMLPGRKAEVTPESAWERAVVLTPRPNEARSLLKRDLRKDLKQEMRSDDPKLSEAQAETLSARIPDDIDNRIYFADRVRVQGPKVSFFVPAEFLGGPAEPTWGYVVVVTGADILTSFDLAAAAGLTAPTSPGLMIVPVDAGTWTNRFGGGREDDDLQPPIIDLIAPKGSRQEWLLRDYSPRDGRPVRLPAVIPAEGGAAGPDG